MSTKVKEMPVVSKLFCAPSQVVLGVRARPHVVGGGGFVVTNTLNHEILFRVDGCGVLGKKDQMTVTDAYQTPLLLIRRKVTILLSLSPNFIFSIYIIRGFSFVLLLMLYREE